MPRGDGTGPNGWGSMTGRGAGNCAGYSAPGYMNSAPGRGFWGGGRGGGRGWRNQFYATGLTGWQRAGMGMPRFAPSWGYPPAYGAPTMLRGQELDALKGEAEYLDGALAEIRKRIEELETEPPK